MPDQPLTLKDIEAALGGFSGTETYYRTQFGLRYTDGIKALADLAGAYWLIDAVASWQFEPAILAEGFQLWRLDVANDKAVLQAMTDCEPDGRLLVQQKIEYTDFPSGRFECYVVNGIMMLKGEY